jgi:hypothetical protein
MTRFVLQFAASHRPRHGEEGQVLVLFVGGLVTLLLIVALVIDLGFTFAIRRQEQDIADPAAIAAARFIRTGPGQTPDLAGMAQAACAYARMNGLFPNGPQCIPANDPDGSTLTVNYPPSISGGTFSGRPGFVEVIIGRQYHSFFANVIGMSQIGVASSAVAAFSAGDSNSSSLIALDPGNSCQAGKTHGLGNINIHPVAGVTSGGYVHVNSTCSNGPPDSACGSTGQGGLDLAGNGTITSPHTYVAGTCKASGNLVGPIDEGAVQIGDPLLELPPPAFGIPNPGAECGVGSGTYTAPTGPGANGCSFNGSGTINLNPGVYYGGWKITSHPTLVLAPGIYVIAGGGVSLSAGGTITSVQGGSGAPAPVMIFNTDNPVTHSGQSTLDFTATGTLKMHAIASGPYRGILVWNDGAGSNPTAAVTLGGQTTLDIAGTIYNPKGSVTLEGGSGVGSTASVQVIAWHFDVGGNATLDMPYDPSQLYTFDEKGLVH